MVVARTLAFLATLAFTPVGGVRAQTPTPPRGWSAAGFQPFAARLLAPDARVTLLEGLPHQLVEHASFLDERRAKRTVEVGGYFFYRTPRPLAPDAAGEVRALCADPQSYGAYTGPKRCGGFHPDYALRWGQGQDAVYTLVCFGCHETQTLDGKRCLIADLPEPAFRRFQTVLDRYHAQRPPFQKGG